MRKNIKLTIGLLLLAGSLTIVGCISKNPAYIPPAPGTTNSPTAAQPYIVDPNIDKYATYGHTGLQTGAALLPTAAPYFTLADGVLTAVAAVLAGISGLLVNSRNKHKNAADSLAQAVVSQGQPAITQALKTAGQNNVAGLVAEHIDNNAPTPPSV